MQETRNKMPAASVYLLERRMMCDNDEQKNILKACILIPLFFLRFVLGLISSSGLGLWLCCIADLPEAMYKSNSPMVGIAPFLNVFFIFIFAWLTYAFLGAAYNCKRFSEGKLPVRWEWPAFWFALVISSVAALYFICAFYLKPCPEPEFIGLIH